MVDALSTVLGIMLMLVNLGIGTTLTVKDFKLALKNPTAVGIGMLSQFGFMPLMAFSMAKIFNVSDSVAIGLILIGSAPGGGTSNLFTYWSKGNVALSITMTFFSNIAALGMMPLMIYLYIDLGGYSEDSIEVDLVSIVVALLIVMIPVFIGGAVRRHNTEKKWRSKYIYEWLEVAGSVSGGIFLLGAFVYGTAVNSEFIFQDAEIWFIALIMEPLGACFGYTFGRVTNNTHRDCRTISLETGIQNSALVIGLVAFVWEDDPETRDEVLVIPYLYSFAYIINSAWITYFLKWYADNGPQDELDADVSKDKQDADTPEDLSDSAELTKLKNGPDAAEDAAEDAADDRIKKSSSQAPTPSAGDSIEPNYDAIAGDSQDVAKD